VLLSLAGVRIGGNNYRMISQERVERAEGEVWVSVGQQNNA